MARFRLLVIISAVWLTFIFNLERPDFDFIGLTNVDLDSVAYAVAAAAALATLWLPDVSRRTEAIFIPFLIVYAILKMWIGNPLAESSIPIIVLEIVVLFLTVALFRRVSLALLSFEHTVDNVLLRQDTLRVLPMEEGIERLKQEMSRARRFERKLGIIIASPRPSNIVYDDYHSNRFDLEEELQKHYIQLRVAQIAELVLFKVDTVMLYKDDVIICMPETDEHTVQRKAEELTDEVRWRMGINMIYGTATFPQDGFIYRDLIDRATIRLYDAEENLILHKDDSQDRRDDHNHHDGGEDNDTEIIRLNGNVPQPVVATTRERIAQAGVVSSLKEIFEPWPDVILRNQQMEKYGVRRPASLSNGFNELHDPNSWLGSLPYQSEESRRLYTLLKRVIDITLVVLMLPIVLPLALIVALLTYIEDRGPILFVQQRTGFGGRRFSMYKFRTMVPDAEEKLKELAAKGLARLNEQGKLAEPLKLKRDPRITRIGRILRKTSLDEIPQLINVVRGDMSLIGPRPTSWSTDSYSLFHTERLRVRPGITGLWQVAARGSTNFDEWVEWDRTYVDKMCLSLDLQIAFRTFTVVFQQRGAR